MTVDQPPFDRALESLGALLAERGLRYELYAVGGGALQLLGLSVRPTKDIDVAAVVERGMIVPAARWARTHDPSDGFWSQLVLALRDLGVPDAQV